MIEVYCKCGCGKKLSNNKIKRGQVFYNVLHSNRWKGKNILLGKKYKRREYGMY